MPAESLKDRIMRSALGASATNPSALDNNPNKAHVHALRDGLQKLLNANDEDLTAQPKIILEKPKAAGAIFAEAPDGKWSGTIYVPQSVYDRQGLPQPSPLSRAEFRIENTTLGLNDQPEKPIIIRGTQEEVASYRNRFDINPRHITVQQANEASPSPTKLREQVTESTGV